jgi:hypothetical protein
MDPVKQAKIAAVVRHALTLISGILAAKGYIDPPNSGEMEILVFAVAGVVGAVPVLWSFRHKDKVENVVETALSVSSHKELKQALELQKQVDG